MVKVSEALKAQFQAFFREMDSSGVAGFAPEHIISLSKDSKEEDLIDKESITTK